MKNTNTFNVTRLEENTYNYSIMVNGEALSFTIKFDTSVIGFLLDKYDGDYMEVESEMHEQVTESLLKMVE